MASYLNWPQSAEVRPSALSRHGFTYEGQGERTRCVACDLVVENWQRGDEPQVIHRNKSPRCPFVIAESSSSSRDVYDVPTAQSIRSQFQQLRVSEPQALIRSDSEILPSTTLPSSSSSAREPLASAAGPSVQPPNITPFSLIDRSHPDFIQLQSESARLLTFHDWPSAAGHIVEPRDLAATGLFYTGHADRVQCAFCRGCLRSWRQGDRPDQEHRRHFPDCPLIRGAVTGNIPCDGATYVVRSSLHTSFSSVIFVAYVLYCIWLVQRLHRVSKNRANLFLPEVWQILTDCENVWHKDSLSA